MFSLRISFVAVRVLLWREINNVYSVYSLRILLVAGRVLLWREINKNLSGQSTLTSL